MVHSYHSSQLFSTARYQRKKCWFTFLELNDSIEPSNCVLPASFFSGREAGGGGGGGGPPEVVDSLAWATAGLVLLGFGGGFGEVSFLSVLGVFVDGFLSASNALVEEASKICSNFSVASCIKLNNYDLLVRFAGSKENRAAPPQRKGACSRLLMSWVGLHCRSVARSRSEYLGEWVCTFLIFPGTVGLRSSNFGESSSYPTVIS